MKNRQWKIKLFWTIRAIGWHRVTTFNNKTIDFKVFIGPVVITFWR